MHKLKYVCSIIGSISIIESASAMDLDKERPSLISSIVNRMAPKGNTARKKYLENERRLQGIKKEKGELIEIVPKLNHEELRLKAEAAKLKDEAMKRKAESQKLKDEAEKLKSEGLKFKDEAEKLKFEGLKHQAEALKFKEQADQRTGDALVSGVVSTVMIVATGGTSLLLDAAMGAQTAGYVAEAVTFSFLSSEAENKSKKFTSLSSETEAKSRQLTSLSSETEAKSRQLISLSSETENKATQLALASDETKNKSNIYNTKIKDLTVQEEDVSSQLKQIGQVIACEDVIRTAHGKTYVTKTMSITNIFSNSNDNEKDQAIANTPLAVSIADYSLDNLQIAVEKAYKELEDARARVTFACRCKNSACQDLEEAYTAAMTADKKANVARVAMRANAATDDTIFEVAAVEADVANKKLASLVSGVRYAGELSREAQARLCAAEEAYKKADALFTAKNLSEKLKIEAYIKIKPLVQNDPDCKHLILNNYGINEAFLIDLCKGLEKNDFLEALYLDSNNITDLGVQRIFLALQKNTSLKKLSLMKNQITIRGVKELANLLKINKTLREIYIDGNPIMKPTIDQLKRYFPKIKINSDPFKDQFIKVSSE